MILGVRRKGMRVVSVWVDIIDFGEGVLLEEKLSSLNGREVRAYFEKGGGRGVRLLRKREEWEVGGHGQQSNR